MISIVNGTGYGAHRRLLDGMFADRKRLFVDLLGWNVPVVAGRFEVDRFDDDHATYIIAGDRRTEHDGSLRLLPTERPHILDTLFAKLCPKGVPSGPDTYEITRLCLPTRHTAPDRLRIRNRLISAMVDHALAVGITTLTGVVAEPFRRQVLAMGWRADALGPDQVIDTAHLGAFRIHIDRDTPDRLAATGIYTPGLLAFEQEGAVA
ncbi:acyl-homoserine-lactone synthase [uncultured Sphingomonas sp.]|uniref:acyl-homoserine-lactone synthase n=1 Tax=uncultured Sphingomonas sp. TaxID=158754 RepID=UPI0035CAEFC4